MQVGKYTPKIHESGGYVEMLIKSEKCPCCGKIMIKKDQAGLFPRKWGTNSQEAQMAEAGLVFWSHVQVDGENICDDCVIFGRADFLCALCGERKNVQKIKESFGDPGEFLCKDCYETAPAKTWIERREYLHEIHEYDFD